MDKQRRRNAYALAQRLLATGSPKDEQQAYAIEQSYGGWTKADRAEGPQRCPACGALHASDFVCRDMRDGLWTLVKDKNPKNDRARQWARDKLGLTERLSKQPDTSSD